jgi:uncharacterized protein
MQDAHYIHNRVLKLNVGYLLSEGPGFSRENAFEIPATLRVAEDLQVDFLYGTIRMSRTSRGILVQGTFQTQLAADCVRCLDETRVPLDVLVEEMFVYPPEPGAAFVVDDSGILDLAPLLREEVVLAIPGHVLCQPDCKGICMECGENRNSRACMCNVVRIDPRLSALAALHESPPATYESPAHKTVRTKKRKGA